MMRNSTWYCTTFKNVNRTKFQTPFSSISSSFFLHFLFHFDFECGFCMIFFVICYCNAHRFFFANIIDSSREICWLKNGRRLKSRLLMLNLILMLIRLCYTRDCMLVKSVCDWFDDGGGGGGIDSDSIAYCSDDLPLGNRIKKLAMKNRRLTS